MCFAGKKGKKTERTKMKTRFVKLLNRYREKRGGKREGWKRMDEGMSYKIPFFKKRKPKKRLFVIYPPYF